MSTPVAGYRESYEDEDHRIHKELQMGQGLQPLNQPGSKLSWKDHLDYVTDKYTACLCQISGTVGKNWGLKRETIKWLLGATESQTPLRSLVGTNHTRQG